LGGSSRYFVTYHSRAHQRKIKAEEGTLMRILKAVGVGLLTGVVVGVLYAWIVGWIAQRRHPEAGIVLVGGARMLLAVIVGFVVGFVWMVRR
jgi:Mg/Co/Ni transporter MgtE